tara:strand:- start:1154 stop:1732 length:579 start_codon:yes stop_codon:yes gene_type:complete
MIKLKRLLKEQQYYGEMSPFEKKNAKLIANIRVLNEQEKETVIVDVSKQGLEPLSNLISESDGVPNATMKNGIISFNYNGKEYFVNLQSIKNIGRFKNMGTGTLYVGNNSEIFEYVSDYNIYLMYNWNGLANPDSEVSKMMNNNNDLFLQLAVGDNEALCFRNKAGQFEMLWFIVTNKTTNEALQLKRKKPL